MNKNVGGLTGLVSVLDHDVTRNSPNVGYFRNESNQGGDSGSTPGTATAPLSGHSSTHSSGKSCDTVYCNLNLFHLPSNSTNLIFF